MQNDPMMIYFDMLYEIGEELGSPAKHYVGHDGGTFSSWYTDYDNCTGAVCHLYGTYEAGNQKQISQVRVLIDPRSHHAIDLIWLAGRNNVALADKPPEWAQGQVATDESFEGHAAAEELRQLRQQSPVE